MDAECALGRVALSMLPNGTDHADITWNFVKCASVSLMKPPNASLTSRLTV
eukprot:SAG11_NODE_7845_length_1089_cov_1.718182_2_plen_50_part_01